MTAWTDLCRFMFYDAPPGHVRLRHYDPAAAFDAWLAERYGSTMTDPTLRSALREAYTLLVSAEPTLIRDAKTGPNETSLHYKRLLRDQVAAWLEPYRDNFDAGVAALQAAQPPSAEHGQPFLARAQAWMARRLEDGNRRGWGRSWQEDYPDSAVVHRLRRAVDHLVDALLAYRSDAAGDDELAKRAADVSNQAWMLADLSRLSRNGNADAAAQPAPAAPGLDVERLARLWHEEEHGPECDRLGFDEVEDVFFDRADAVVARLAGEGSQS